MEFVGSTVDGLSYMLIGVLILGLLVTSAPAGVLTKNNLVQFRGDSGLHDGNSSTTNVDLVGGFYDSEYVKTRCKMYLSICC